MSDLNLSRREVLAGLITVGGSIVLKQSQQSDSEAPRNPFQTSGSRAPADELTVVLSVNGERHVIEKLAANTSLLDCLRDDLQLTGTKKGCGLGHCGACTLLIDGRRVTSCLTLAVMQQGKKITTIEGLAKGDNLHPVQAAFIEHDGFQCGYCTPGQIMSAIACIDEAHAGSDAEIREWMSGNICRCGAYTNIVAAVRSAAARSL